MGQDLGVELVQNQIQHKLKVYHNLSIFQRADVDTGEFCCGKLFSVRNDVLERVHTHWYQNLQINLLACRAKAACFPKKC